MKYGRNTVKRTRKHLARNHKWMQWKLLLFGLFLISSLTGCGKQFDVSQKESQQSRNDLIVVGVSQVGSESVWRTANTASLQRTFTRENGYLMIFDNARQKQENQIKAIRSFISQGVDYIVFSPITEEGWDTVLSEAKQAGIPVILMDRKIKTEDETLYTAWVGSDFVREGRDAGQWLEEYLKTSGKTDESLQMVMLLGTDGSTSMIGRKEGFCEVLKKHANWKMLAYIDADYTTAKAYEEMRKAFGKYGDIDVVISQNDDMTFGAIEAIQSIGKTPGLDGDVILLSFDAVKEALGYVQDGIIGVDVECNPDQGSYISRIIQSIEGNKSFEKDTYVDEQIFTKDIVADYIENRIY